MHSAAAHTVLSTARSAPPPIRCSRIPALYRCGSHTTTCAACRLCHAQNDLPGPGTYDDHTQALSDDKVYSKKGLGVGFVSKTQRSSAFGASSVAPGPGSYEAGGRPRAGRPVITSTFKPPTTRSVIVTSDPLPGPGNYSMPRSFDPATTAAMRQHAASSVFKSRVTRGAQPGAQPTPAPGQYDSSMAQIRNELPSAAFSSTVPSAGHAASTRLTREQELGIVEHAPSGVPGPGEYEAARSSVAPPGGMSRRMPQFCDSNIDRFGKPLGHAAAQPLTPGPGAYYREEARETAILSGSVFMSGTSRWKSQQGAVPGPAYYSPAADARKSFHLNARQRWVPTL